MRFRAWCWGALFGAAFVPVIACDNGKQCQPGQAEQPVRNSQSISGGASSYDYICEDSPDESTTGASDPSATAPAATATAPTSPGSSPFGPTDGGTHFDASSSNGGSDVGADSGLDPDSGAAADSGVDAGAPTQGVCATLPTVSPDITFLSVAAAPPAITDGVPPDGTYTLTQAFAYYGVTPPLVSLSATLAVSGATLEIGAQASNPALEDNESFTVVFSNAQIILVCKTRTGATALTLFPKSPGTAESAHLAWDSAAKLMTLRLQTASGVLDLFFAAQ